MPSEELSELAGASARRLLQALDRGETSSLALCEAAIARIEAGDREINAVVVRDFDRARAQARAADAALARGERLPLLGLPMTVKEAFNVAGLPTTWGFGFAREWPVTQDAVAVSRLKAAGAVILGKTNVATALGDWQSTNPVYGRTLHPLDPSRTPGGSSGGSAAAVAAGYVALELGSDIGGSIRVPAHFCGVAGHKPTHGLLPTRGHDFPGHVAAPDPLSVIGPIARTVDDLSLALDVLAGPLRPESVACRVELAAPRCASAAGLRVLALPEHPGACASGEVRAAVDGAASALADAGARVVRSHPELPDLSDVLSIYRGMLFTIITRGRPDPGQVISAHDWLALLDRRDRVREQCQRLFEAVDVVVAPAFGTSAFTHVDEPDWDRRKLPVDGVDTPYGDQIAWASLASLAGLPATVVPVARGAAGMPIGVQVIGPAFEDRTTLTVAGWLPAPV